MSLRIVPSVANDLGDEGEFIVIQNIILVDFLAKMPIPGLGML